MPASASEPFPVLNFGGRVGRGGLVGPNHDLYSVEYVTECLSVGFTESSVLSMNVPSCDVYGELPAWSVDRMDSTVGRKSPDPG